MKNRESIHNLLYKSVGEKILLKFCHMVTEFTKLQEFSVRTFKMNICGHMLIWELKKGGKYISDDPYCKSS